MKIDKTPVQFFAFAIILLFSVGACSDSGINELDDLDDVIDVVDGVPRKTIDTSRMGVNAFSNQGFAGSICSQFAEIRNELRLNYVRVLFNWDDGVQPSPGAPLNFSFYDDILSCIPRGVDALVILSGLPTWMSNPANWEEGNPRLTFARQWVAPAAQRYGGNGRVVGFQIFNEPNNPSFPDNVTLDVLQSPENYVELVSLSSNFLRNSAPGKLILNGATTAIAQNFPDTVNYNRAMRDAGIQEFIDVYAIHYYGRAFERFVIDVRDFLNGLSKPIWITESGIMGVDEQLPYVEQVWPFLRDNVSAIDRIYYYRFAEATPPASSFGLRTPDAAQPVSNLYTYLRDR